MEGNEISMDRLIDAEIALAILEKAKKHSELAVVFQTVGNSELSEFELDFCNRLKDIAESYHQSAVQGIDLEKFNFPDIEW